MTDAYMVSAHDYCVVRGIALRWCRIYGVDDVEDIAHDAMVRIIERIASYNPARRFDLWALAVVKNVIRSFIKARERRAKREAAYALMASMGTFPDPRERHRRWERGRGNQLRRERRKLRKLQQTSGNSIVVREHAPAGA